MAMLLLMFFSVLSITHSCSVPPTICGSYHDETQPRLIHEIMHGPSAGLFCVCPSYNYDVCFDSGSSFEPGTLAFELPQPDGCTAYIATTEASSPAQARQCEIEDSKLWMYFEESRWGENVVCSEPITDKCCPERGTLCLRDNLSCDQPRCRNIETTGCLSCACLPPTPLPCPDFAPPECYFYEEYHCCADLGVDGFLCQTIGTPTPLPPPPPGGLGPVLPPLPQDNFLDDCPGEFDLTSCYGTVVSDEMCCPINCIAAGSAPCDCNGLSDGNTDTWNIDIQRDNSQDPYDVAGSSGVDVGGRKRVFVSRADNSEFCISSLSISVECMTLVYIKIYQMQDGKPQPIAINENIAVPVASQTGVYTATFDYPDTLRRVVSFRLGFKKEKSAACAGKSSASNLVVQPCQAK